MYVTINVRRALSAAIVFAVLVIAVVGWSYAVGRRDGATRDRVEVCQTMGATDAAPCVAVLR